MKVFLRRFFEPSFLDKKEFLKSFLGTFVNAVYFDILPIICFPLLITYIQNGETEKIYLLTILFFLGVTLSFSVRVSMRGWYWYSQRRFHATLDLKYRPIIFKKESVFFEKTGTGKLQSIIDNGLSTWARVNNDSIWYLTRMVISILIGVYVVSKVDTWILGLFLLCIFVSLIFVIYFRRKKYLIDLAQKEIRNEYNATSVRSIMSRNEVIFSGKIDRETKKLFELKSKEHEMGIKSDIYGAFSVVPSEIFFLVLPFVGSSLYLYMNQVSLNATTIAVLISFVYFCSKMTTMIWQMIGFVYLLTESFPDVKKFWDFLDNVSDMKNYDTGKIFKHGRGEIDFKKVSFSYENVEVISNLNLKIKGGERLALVGKSGSGKTTIAKLVSGYVLATNGYIYVDGQDLTELSLKSYYKYIGYLTQEPSVFDGTILENLLYAVDRKPKKEEVEKALLKASCDFVFRFKEGVHTHIGEKGVRLSGGERQRLAIAKLFLKNPEIIILDEPTSALDSFSEDLISKSLEELFVGRTVIVIAHRLQTVRKANRILVLEDGKILEDGTHDELLKIDGAYKKMLELQSGF